MRKKSYMYSRSSTSGSDQMIKNSRKGLDEEESEKIRKKMEKTILLSGISVSIIESSTVLTNHFCFILHFCKNIIGYSLNGSHKAFIVKCLKKITSGVVMSVGDGFNDMSMLREASVGVQISHRDVPLIFGDVVISEMKILNYLLFVKGKQIYSNYVVFCLMLITMLGSISSIIFSFNASTLFSGRFFSFWTIFIMFVWIGASVVSSTTSNETFTRLVLEKNPEFYLERRTLNQNFLTICAGCLLLSIIDSTVINFSMNYILQKARVVNGYMMEQNAISLHVFLTMTIVIIFKIYMLFIRLGKSFWFINLAAILCCTIFLLLVGTADDSVVDVIPLR